MYSQHFSGAVHVVEMTSSRSDPISQLQFMLAYIDHSFVFPVVSFGLCQLSSEHYVPNLVIRIQHISTPAILHNDPQLLAHEVYLVAPQRQNFVSSYLMKSYLI